MRPKVIGRIVEQDEAGVEGGKATVIEIIGPGINQRSDDGPARPTVSTAGVTISCALRHRHGEFQHLQIRFVEALRLVVFPGVGLDHAHPGKGFLA